MPIKRRCARLPFAFAMASVVAIGAFLRLYRLGAAAFRADTMEFWRVCHSTVSAGTLWKDWLKIMGRTAQFPFPLVVTKGVLDLLGLPPTDFWVRFPSALWGVLTVPAAYLLGATLGRRRLGLFLALLYALNPLHIQVSREAYYYAPLHLGGVILVWSALWVLRHSRRPQPLGKGFLALTAAGFFLTCYSQLSGWWLAGLTSLASLAVLARWARRLRARRKDLAVLAGLYTVLGAPLLVLPWAVPYFYADQLHPEVKEHTLRVSAHLGQRSFWQAGWEAGTVMAWGRTGPRLFFAAVVLAVGLALLASRRRRHVAALLLYLVLGGWVLYYVGYIWTGTMFSLRHAAFVLPAFLSFLALSIWRASVLPPVRRAMPPRSRRLLAHALAALAAGLWIGPAWAVTQVEGKPTPYKKIVRVVDELFPRGTPVLVDRWYEPWNELQVHPSTNVFFTFTVPNEPLDVFKQVNWRQTAIEFFRKYPDAAYLEIAKSYFEVPEVGFWHWPREYFARHVVITDEAGLRLRRWGLAMRDDYYHANTNRLVVELFYNRPEDVLARARGEDRPVLLLYGPGWKYTKTQDYRDWRVLEDHAELELHNLTDRPQLVMLYLQGVALGGTKRVSAGAEVSRTFEAQRLADWALGPIALQPGKQVLRLRDDLWPLARVPLLLGEARLETVGQADAAAAETPDRPASPAE